MKAKDFRGVFEITIYDKDGNIKDKFECENTVMLAAREYLLKVGLSNQLSPTTTWYVGIYGNNVTPNENDTAATALGSSGTYGEITAYSEATRRQYQGVWVQSDNGVSNKDNLALFTATSDITVYGTFIVSVSTKNSTSGLLFSAGKFATSKSLSANDVLAVKYVVKVTP